MIFLTKTSYRTNKYRCIFHAGLGLASLIGLMVYTSSLLISCTDTSPNSASPSEETAGRVLSRERYERAQALLEHNALAAIRNAEVKPFWIGDSEYFWYRRETEEGMEFILVNANEGNSLPAFDHRSLANRLTDMLNMDISPSNLPFDFIEFSPDRDTVSFYIGSDLLVCSLNDYSCSKSSLGIDLAKFDFSHETAATLSPDKRWVVDLRHNNLWARSTVTGSERPLTTDGSENNAYAHTGTLFGNVQRVHDYVLPPDILWSPDSSKLLALRVNSEGIRRAPIVRYAPPNGDRAPQIRFFDYVLPQDKNFYDSQYWVIDIQTGEKLAINGWPGRVPEYQSPMRSGYVWWPEDDLIYFLHEDRFRKRLSLNRADLSVGQVAEIFAETSDTYINPHLGNYSTLRAEVRVLHRSKEFIWFSERTGWAQLYLYNLESGELKNPITSGNYVVHSIVYVDENNRKLAFLAGGREEGRDPYLGHLYSVNFDGSDLTLVTPEDADHKLYPRDAYYRAQAIEKGLADWTRASPAPSSYSYNGKFFVETIARLDRPSKSVLKRADGSVVTVLEEADITKLVDAGWKSGKPFQVKAADNITDLYGVLFFPSDFDPNRSYPIIDGIYAGPTSKHTPKTLRDAFIPGSGSYHFQALAELGFVVMVMDGRGTSYRSKEFHDYLYAENLKLAGLEDHVFALKQLAQQYSFIDIERVGIYGHSYGGYAATRAILSYPEFFKVAVASAPMQSMDLDGAPFGDWMNGPFTNSQYEAQHNRTLARSSRIKGKFLVLHGDTDANSPMWGSLQVVDALIETNQDFEMLIMPNQTHDSITGHPYHIRKVFDYFVRHLLNLEPPIYDFAN